MKEAFEVVMEPTSGPIPFRPGVPCAKIDRAANGFLKEQGFGERMLHRTGHGFGLSNHEGPCVAGGSDQVLAGSS